MLASFTGHTIENRYAAHYVFFYFLLIETLRGHELIWLYEESNKAHTEQRVEVIEPLQPFNVTDNVTEVDVSIIAKQVGSVILFLQVKGQDFHK